MACTLSDSESSGRPLRRLTGNSMQIEQIDKSLDGLESELCIARRLLSTFTKR